MNLCLPPEYWEYRCVPQPPNSIMEVFQLLRYIPCKVRNFSTILSLICIIFSLHILCIYIYVLCTCLCPYTPWCMCGDQRTFSGTGLLLPRGSQGWKLGCQDWQQHIYLMSYLFIPLYWFLFKCIVSFSLHSTWEIFPRKNKNWNVFMPNYFQYLSNLSLNLGNFSVDFNSCDVYKCIYFLFPMKIIATRLFM